MASDPLTHSVKRSVQVSDHEQFVVWVKRYKSGRTRVLFPAGYEVTAVINNGDKTNDARVELQPKKKEKRR